MAEQGAGRRDVALIAGLVVLVVLLFGGSLAVGPVFLSPGVVVEALFGRGSEAATIIVREIRLPRAILALLIGGTLGLSGAALQGCCAIRWRRPISSARPRPPRSARSQ